METLKDWLNGIGYSVLTGTDEVCVSDVIFDSRKIKPGTVFVCMKGSRIDSHDFIPDAVKKGCNTFVVEKGLDELGVVDTSGLNIIRTDNARRALSYLSTAFFGHPADKMRVIGLTGTKGKTSTSYIFKSVLEACGSKVGVIGTNGCVIGDEHFDTLNTTPDSYELNSFFVKMLEKGCDTVVMECSSQGFKMDRTAGIRFNYGVFLNISPDHIGPLEHADFDEYMYCKSKLFENCEKAVINLDDGNAGYFIDAAEKCGSEIISFSLKDENADIRACDIKFRSDAELAGTQFKAKGKINESFDLSIPGEYNVSNSLSVLAVAQDMGLDMEKVKRAFSSIHVDGRMEVVYKSDDLTVIVDYAHNEVSMENLMQTLRAYDHNRLVVVFGCGGNRSKERRTGMGGTAAKTADFSIFTSDNSRFEKPEDIIADIEEAYLAAGGKKDGYIKIPDRRSAIRYAMENAGKGDIIAVIGKGHEDYQEENGVRRHFLDREEILKIRDELGL